MSERHGSGRESLEEEQIAAVRAPPPPPPPPTSSPEFAAAASNAYVFDDASTIGSAGDGSDAAGVLPPPPPLDSWIRDDDGGHQGPNIGQECCHYYYCPRHPNQRKPYKPHRNSICSECLLESQRSRQSLEQRKKAVEAKLQRLLFDDSNGNLPNDEQGDGNESTNDAAETEETAAAHGDGALKLNAVMKDWTNSLQRHAPHASHKSSLNFQGPAMPAAKSEDGACQPSPPHPPIVEATFQYSSPAPVSQQQQQPTATTTGYAPYECYSYAPPSADPTGSYYPSHPPHAAHPPPTGYASEASPAPAADPRHPPPYAPQIPPQYQPHQHQHPMLPSTSQYPSQAPAAVDTSQMHPSYPPTMPGAWATYGAPEANAGPAAAGAAAVADAFVAHLFHMMERQDGMLVQKIRECDGLKKALDEVTTQIHELRVDNAQLQERIVQQGEQMRHELDLIRREVVAAVAAAAGAPQAPGELARPQHVHRTPSPPRKSRGGRLRRSRTSSADHDAAHVAEPLLLTDSPHRADGGANSGEDPDAYDALNAEPAAPSNESPFLPDEDQSGLLSGVKLEPTRWGSSTERPDLSPPVQWFPFRSEDVKGCPFTVFADDDNDFHDPFGVGAVATADVKKADAPPQLLRKGATEAAGKPQAAFVEAASANPRNDIDWERSELAV